MNLCNLQYIPDRTFLTLRSRKDKKMTVIFVNRIICDFQTDLKFLNIFTSASVIVYASKYNHKTGIKHSPPGQIEDICVPFGQRS